MEASNRHVPILDLIPFNTLFNDMDDEEECTFRKFVVTKTREEWLVEQRIVLPSVESLTFWRTGFIQVCHGVQ